MKSPKNLKCFKTGSYSSHAHIFALCLNTAVEKRGRSVLDTLIQAGPLFATTMAASAICLSLYQCPQLLHSVHYFSFLFLNQCILKNKIGIKCYIRLSYTTQRFNICTYFEMVTTLSQHPSLNVDTESLFLMR